MLTNQSEGARNSTNQSLPAECNAHARYPSEGIKGTVPPFLPFPSVTCTRHHVYLGRNPRSLAKTRLLRLEPRSQVPFLQAATQGYSTVAPPIAFDQSQRSSQHSTTTTTTTPTTTTTTTTITMHKCATCGRVFTRRFTLQRHASGCRPKPFVCTVCDSSFGRKQELDRHKRTVQCGGPPQPGPASKRRKVTHLQEDPVLAPPVEHAANDELSSAIRDFVHEN